MSQPPVAPAPLATSRAGWDRALSAVLALGALASVPFVVTWMYRQDLDYRSVTLVCTAVAAGLWLIPRRGRWLAAGWLLGCVLWAAFLFWLFSKLDFSFLD